MYWPNEIPTTIKDQYELDKIISGDTSGGADVWCVPKIKNKLTAVEVKSENEGHKKRSLNLGRLAIKETQLNKTKVGKNDRICVYDFQGTSRNLDYFLDNWATIHIDQLFNEQSFFDIKKYILEEKLPEQQPYDYRDDLQHSGYHEKQLTRIADKILAQKKQHGNSRGLVIKPTATGKGVDPLLLFRKHLLPTYKNSKKYDKIVEMVSPSLNVLTGNVLKQIKDHMGSGFDVETVIKCSDLTPSDDPKDLVLLETLVTVAKTDKQLQDIVDKAKKQGRWIWLHTTLHSYYNVERALYSTGARDIFIQYIDEVKHTVQDWDSNFCRPLKDNLLRIKHRVGFDGNILEGREASDENGIEYHSSMGNKKIWREIYEEMPEDDAVKLGWKRRTRLVVIPFEDSRLPDKLRESLYENKNGFVKIKGTGVSIPFTWVQSIYAVIIARLKNPKFKHTMVSTNKIVWSNGYARAFRSLLPKILSTITISKQNKFIINRLKKLKIVSIYDLGNSGKKIQRKVDSIPNLYNDSVIVQVKLLTEGWDPKKAWLDSWSFADPTASKIRIYQTGGRPARIGDDIFDPNRLKESICIQPLILQSDLSKEIAINRAFKQLALVASAMEIGKDTIKDSITFLFWKSVNSASSTRTSGTSSETFMLGMTAQTMTDSFCPYYKSNRRFSPWADTVDAIYNDTKKLYNLKNNHDTLVKQKFYNTIQSKIEYKDFFSNFQKNRRNKIIGAIGRGRFWILSEANQLEGQTLHRQQRQNYIDTLEQESTMLLGGLKRRFSQVKPEDIAREKIDLYRLACDETGKRFPTKLTTKIARFMQPGNKKNPYVLLGNQKCITLRLHIKKIIKNYQAKLKVEKNSFLQDYSAMVQKNSFTKVPGGKIIKGIKELLGRKYKWGKNSNRIMGRLIRSIDLKKHISEYKQNTVFLSKFLEKKVQHRAKNNLSMYGLAAESAREGKKLYKNFPKIKEVRKLINQLIEIKSNSLKKKVA